MSLKIVLTCHELFPASIIYRLKENLLVLKLNEIPFDILLLKELDISICLGGKLYTEFRCGVTSMLWADNELKMNLSSKLPEFMYDQEVIDVYQIWEANSDRSFYKLPPSKKKAWLFNCLIFSGLPKQILKSTVHIDCKNIKNDYDLFFTFAEALIGPKGYLGQDFDGFRDCLYLCGKSDTSVYLKDANQLDRIFAAGDESFTKHDFFSDFLKLGYTLVEV